MRCIKAAALGRFPLGLGIDGGARVEHAHIGRIAGPAWRVQGLRFAGEAMQLWRSAYMGMSKDPGCVTHGVPHNTWPWARHTRNLLHTPSPGPAHAAAQHALVTYLSYTHRLFVPFACCIPPCCFGGAVRVTLPFFYILLHNPRNIPCNILVTNPRAARKFGQDFRGRTHLRIRTAFRATARGYPKPPRRRPCGNGRTRRGAAAIAVSFRRIVSWWPDTTLPRLGAPRVPAACSFPRARVGARRCWDRGAAGVRWEQRDEMRVGAVPASIGSVARVVRPTRGATHVHVLLVFLLLATWRARLPSC